MSDDTLETAPQEEFVDGERNDTAERAPKEEFADDEESEDEEPFAQEQEPWNVTWPLHLEPEAFDQLVSDVMDGLPEEWAPILDNMAVVVENEPSTEEAPDEQTEVFGLYRGSFVPAQFLSGGLAGPAMTAPPEIALFQGPLERASVDLDDLRERVRVTLVQETGRRFGLTQEGAEDEEWLDDEDEDE